MPTGNNIVIWNRLEGRARTENMEQPMRCEIRDPLWMLTRQWQMGEFAAEDRGLPINAALSWQSTPIQKLQLGHGKSSQVTDYDESLPLEAVVEKQPINWTLPFRIEIGKYWLKFLQAQLEEAGATETYIDDKVVAFRKASYLRFKLPSQTTEGQKIQHVRSLTNRRLMQYLQAIQHSEHRPIDGGKLINYLNATSSRKASGLISGSHSDVDAAGLAFKEWFNQRYLQPSTTRHNAWDASHQEYQFALGAQGFQESDRIALKAEGYHHGRMDWYALEKTATNDPQLSSRTTYGLDKSLVHSEKRSFIPAELQFPGIPNRRWWEVENRTTSYGNIGAQPNELANLVLAEFGMLYSNDWFVIPVNVPVGHLIRCNSIVLTDNFGQKTSIEHYEEAQSNPNWSLFDMSRKRENAFLLIPPVMPSGMESAAVEKVHFTRDELANLVWAIEHTIPDEAKGQADGRAAAARVKQYLQDLTGAADAFRKDIPEDSELHYQFSSQIAEHWIPFVPVQMKEGEREIAFQRASLPRQLPGHDTKPVRPQTTLLQEGLLADRWIRPFYIHEEEIPKSGISVKKSWQRVRWHDGRIVLWMGYQKTNGQGEKYGALQFDQLRSIR
ncbi:MAG: hypothetical protein AAFV95_21970 [Bacteroidota bacterium]